MNFVLQHEQMRGDTRQKSWIGLLLLLGDLAVPVGPYLRF